MSLSTICGNCGQPKGPEEWTENYCSGCRHALAEAEEYAKRENLDLSETRRLTLLRRSQHINANRPDPRVPYEKTGKFDFLSLGEASKVPPGMIPAGDSVPLDAAGNKAL